MLSFSLTIPKNGTIVIPKQIRDIICTSNIIINIDDDNIISIIPVEELKGRFSKYKKNIEQHIDDESEIAWGIHVKDLGNETDD